MSYVIVTALAPIFFVMTLGFVAGRMRTIDNHHVGEINALIICPAGFSVCGDRSAQRAEMMAQGPRSAIFFPPVRYCR
jgi:malonate transporter